MTKTSLIPTLLPKGEGLNLPLPWGEGMRVREGLNAVTKVIVVQYYFPHTG